MHANPDNVLHSTTQERPLYGYLVAGVHYSTLSGLARAYNIKATTLSRRLRSAHWTVEQACGLVPAPRIIDTQHGKPLTVHDKQYPSMAAACAAFGIKTGVFHARRRSGWSIEEALEVAPRKKHTRGVSGGWFIAGTHYPSLREACAAHGLKSACVRSRLAMGWTLEEAFGLVSRTEPRKLTPEERSGNSGILIICGKPFVWRRARVKPV